MKRYFFLTIVISLLAQSEAFAQGRFLDELQNRGQQILQQEFGISRGRQRNGGNQHQGIQSNSIPSESGRNSGGNGRQFTPGGGGFLLPGNGQPVQPNPQLQPRQPFQPNFQPQLRQPIYPGNSYQNQQVFPGQPFNQGSQSYPHQSNGTIAHSYDLPTSPVMSRDYVTIKCPEKVVGAITYTLASNRGNFVFTMSAGQEQKFKANTDWTVSYNEGAQQKKYRLIAGESYAFKRKPDNNWQIYRDQ